MAKVVISAKYRLVEEDVKKWSYNALVFAAPALVVLVASLRDIVPGDAGWGVIALYLVNVLTDLGRKFVKESQYR